MMFAMYRLVHKGYSNKRGPFANSMQYHHAIRNDMHFCSMILWNICIEALGLSTYWLNHLVKADSMLRNS
jgi:hypothetical protein